MKLERFLKQLTVVLVALAMTGFVLAPVLAGDKELTFAWEQNAGDLPNLVRWELYKTEDNTVAWPWTKVGDIPYDGNPGSTYNATFTITVPDGVETSMYFKMIAVDNQGQVSEPSEEAVPSPVVIDFKPPASPVLAGTYNPGAMTVDLTWTQDAADDDVAKWEVYMKEGSGAFAKMGESTTLSYSYDASGDLGKTLTFAVVAFDNDANFSPNSNEESFAIMPNPPTVPFGLTVTVVSE